MTDEELIVRVGQGEVALFETLVRRYQGPALRLARRFSCDCGEAEELAQETFLQVYRYARQFKSGASFKPWFFTILSNFCRNALKRRKCLPVGACPAEYAAPDDPANTLYEKEQRQALAQAICRLPANQQLALFLCTYEELSYAEAAEVLHLSIKAIESLLVRAKRTLRQELATPRKKSLC